MPTTVADLSNDSTPSPSYGNALFGPDALRVRVKCDDANVYVYCASTQGGLDTREDNDQAAVWPPADGLSATSELKQVDGWKGQKSEEGTLAGYYEVAA